MSTYTNPAHLVRAGFYAAGAALAAMGAADLFGPREGPAGSTAGQLVFMAICLFFALYTGYTWRRAMEARDALLPRMLAPGGAPGAGVLAQWRVGDQEWRDLARLQPKMEHPAVLLFSGVLVVAFVAMFAIPSFTSAMTVAGVAAAAAALILLFFGSHLRFDARRAGDGTEIVIARDAVVVAGRFHWLRDPEERLAAADVVENGGQAYLRILIASFGRFGARLEPIWIPVPAPRVEEARRIAAELGATVHPRLARVMAAAR